MDDLSVAVLGANFWPEPTGSAPPVTEFARYLNDHGIAIRVATAMPYYPEWRIHPAYRGAIWRSDVVDGIHIYRSWHWVRPRPTTMSRLLHELSLALCGFPCMIRAVHRAQKAYVVTPLLTYAFAASLVCGLMRVPYVLVVHDIMPDTAVALGLMTNRVLVRASQWMARLMYRMASEIHVLGEGMRQRILFQAPSNRRIRVVPITIDASELAPVPTERNEFVARFVRPGTFSVLHAGNIGRKQDLDVVLEAADRLKADAAIRFFVVGEGAAKDEFLTKLAALDGVNLRYLPLQDRWMVPHMLSGADVVLVTQRPAVVDIVVPSKLMVAFGVGAMVVGCCAEDSEVARLLSESGGGMRVPAGNGEALAEALTAIRDNRLVADECRKNARMYALRAFERGTVYGPIVSEIVHGRRVM